MTSSPNQPPPPGKRANRASRGYKRSWKNLLINKRYQLRFTLFMVVLSALLMAGLGIWVMMVANETTQVGAGRLLGTQCDKPKLIENALDEDDADVPPVPMKIEPPPPADAPMDTPTAAPAGPVAGSDSVPPVAAGSAAEPAEPSEPADEPARRRVTVQIDEIKLTPIPPKVTPDYTTKMVAYWTCELKLAGKFADLEHGRKVILWVLIFTGLGLVLGLAAYGIKMTHRVAGPLFKVQLYFAKMRDGRFDKVWNLRKGDQLIEFYEHFKTAHAGVVEMQQQDIAQAKAVIAAAEAAGAGEHPAVAELRELVARKEKSLE
ncbi:MAG: hypothetical protein AB7O24_29460 [Kofleriaceae bacterium]